VLKKLYKVNQSYDAEVLRKDKSWRDAQLKTQHT
jgi:hypothetical protein